MTFAERAFGLLRFLAVVWSIAAGFLVIQKLQTEMIGLIFARGLVAPEMALPRSREQAAAARCAAEVAALPPSPALPPALARYTGWRAGLAYGRTGFLLARDRPDAGWPRLFAEVRAAAGVLAVPPPPPPQPQRFLTAMTDFTDRLLDDPTCTLAAIEARHGPNTAAAFRFGAALGYSAAACAGGVCGSFSAELRSFGPQARLPEALWRPFVEAGPDAARSVERLLAGLDAAFRSPAP